MTHHHTEGNISLLSDGAEQAPDSVHIGCIHTGRNHSLSAVRTLLVFFAIVDVGDCGDIVAHISLHMSNQNVIILYSLMEQVCTRIHNFPPS